MTIILNGLSLEEVQNLFYKAESTYVLKVERENQQMEVQLEMLKKNVDNVETNLCQENTKNIGYIRLSMFSFSSAKEFETEFTKLKEQGFDSLIIDLRDNLGGEEKNLVKIASMFLDNKKVICNKQYRNKTEVLYSKGKKTADYPIVILGNNNTASCSEMFMGALIEGCNAKFIGTNTCGKGVGQRVVGTKNYLYKFTESVWTMPSGKSINKIGIKPDIEIENKNGEDLQLQKAKEYLISLE